MKTVMLILLLSSVAGATDTDINPVRNEVEHCNLDKALSFVQEFDSSKLKYTINPGAGEIDYSYPKEKMLGYLNFIKSSIATCDDMPTTTIKEGEDRVACFKGLPSKPDNQDFLLSGDSDQPYSKWPLAEETHYILDRCSKTKAKAASNQLVALQDKEDTATREKQIADNKGKWEAQLNSSEGVALQLCNTNRSLTQLNKLLAKQKAATEITGVQNKVELNKLGLAIVNHKESMDGGKEKYKKVSGKDWDVSVCK